MKKGRFKRNRAVIIAGVISLVLSICTGLTPSSINNYTDIMSASLAFSALATAMFLSTFSLIPAFSNSKFIKALQEMGTDFKIMDRLIISTLIFFLSSLLTFVALFFDASDESSLSHVVVSLWLVITVMGLVSTFYVIMLLLRGFEFYYEMSENPKQE